MVPLKSIMERTQWKKYVLHLYDPELNDRIVSSLSDNNELNNVVIMMLHLMITQMNIFPFYWLMPILLGANTIKFRNVIYDYAMILSCVNPEQKEYFIDACNVQVGRY